MGGNFVSVIFCKRCGSRYVEVPGWSTEGKAVFHCRSCGYTEEMRGFTLGRARVGNIELQNARDTSARKGSYEK